MSGVFLSYSRADRDLAERIVVGLRGLGADVWWDEDMPGVDWREELNRQLERLSAVLVIWTPASSGSKNVMAEARLGDRKEKLVNVICGVPSPPAPFDAINGLPLDGWTGAVSHHGWERVVRTVEDFLVKSGDAKPGDLIGALRERQTAIRERQQALAQAEDAFRDAKSAEGEASEASHAAETAFAAAEEQLGWVVGRRGAASLLRAAQGELDTASARREAAQSMLQSAATALASASRAMTRARSELEREIGEPAPRAPLASDLTAAEAVRPHPEPASEPSAAESASASAVTAPSADGPNDSPAGEAAAPPRPIPSADPAADRSMAETATATPAAEAAPVVERSGQAPAPRARAAESWRWAVPNRRVLIALAGAAALILAWLAAPLAGRWYHVFHLQRLAKAGERDAQSDLAFLYKDNGSPPFLPGDKAKAEYWFERAADQGDSDAQFYVAEDYQWGTGVAQDWSKAVSWYQKAATLAGGGVVQEDRATAEARIAQMYEQGGYNLTADPAQARAWYMKAAADGDKDAIAWLSQNPSGAASTNSIPP
jgi:TIR domain/Sel1 repeat